MRVLLNRTRIGVEAPTYSYRVYVPFSELSHERQALIAMQSDYGMGAGLLARLPDVIAPPSHLESAPGLAKHHFAERVDGVASRLAAIFVAAAFAEMTEHLLPFRHHVPAAPPNSTLYGEVQDLTGRYDALARRIDTLTAAGLRFRLETDR